MNDSGHIRTRQFFEALTEAMEETGRATLPTQFSITSAFRSLVFNALNFYRGVQATFNRSAVALLEEFEKQLSSVQQVVGRLQSDLPGLRDQLNAVDAKLNVTNATLENLSSNLTRLTQIGSRPDLAEQHRILAERLEQTQKWIDSIRKELFYELRFKLEEIERSTEPEILDPEAYRIKIAGMPEGPRVNLGSGVVGLRGTHQEINVDMRAVEGVDIRADVRKLPFGEGEIAELNSYHLIEHFNDEEMRQRIMPYWFKLLKPGGLLRVVCPDSQAMIQKYVGNEFPYEALREVLFGSQEYDGNRHFNMFTPQSLSKLLNEIGFSDIRCVAEGRPNGQCLEMEIEARKPLAQ